MSTWPGVSACSCSNLPWEVGDLGDVEQLVGVGLEEEEGGDLDLVADRFVNVVADCVREFLALLPEPGVLLGEGLAGGFFGGGVVEIGRKDDIGRDAPG